MIFFRCPLMTNLALNLILSSSVDLTENNNLLRNMFDLVVYLLCDDFE